MLDIEKHATFWEHIEELRSTLLTAFAIILIAMVVPLLFYSTLFSILQSSLQSANPSLQIQRIERQSIHNPTAEEVAYSIPNHARGEIGTLQIPAGGTIEIELLQPIYSLAILDPMEGIATTLKICFWGGVAFSSPIWLWLLLQFVMPALRQNTQRLMPLFLGASLLFLGAGALFAYYITLPLANRYLYSFNAEIGHNLWSLENYFDYTVLLLLANALAAELILGLFFLVHYGKITPQGMVKKRRLMIVVAFILGALLTPPDLLTQFLLAIPLIICYEIAIFYGNLRQKYTLKKRAWYKLSNLRVTAADAKSSLGEKIKKDKSF